MFGDSGEVNLSVVGRGYTLRQPKREQIFNTWSEESDLTFAVSDDAQSRKTKIRHEVQEILDKLGNAVRYKVADLLDWFERNKVGNTSQTPGTSPNKKKR